MFGFFEENPTKKQDEKEVEELKELYARVALKRQLTPWWAVQSSWSFWIARVHPPMPGCKKEHTHSQLQQQQQRDRSIPVKIFFCDPCRSRPQQKKCSTTEHIKDICACGCKFVFTKHTHKQHDVFCHFSPRWFSRIVVAIVWECENFSRCLTAQHESSNIQMVLVVYVKAKSNCWGWVDDHIRMLLMLQPMIGEGWKADTSWMKQESTKLASVCTAVVGSRGVYKFPTSGTTSIGHRSSCFKYVVVHVHKKWIE